MTAANIQHRVVEFFTLRDATREVTALSEEARSSVLRGLRLAFQKREAAETLWPRGSTAEALALAAAALEGAISALAGFTAEPPPEWVVRARDVAANASKRLAEVELPSLEKETLPTHDDVFRVVSDSLVAIEELVGVKLAAPVALRRIRNVRRVAAAVSAVVVLAVLIRMLQTPTFAKATASGQYGPDFGPEKAIDGDVSTCWNLPDRVAQGWIDFELGKPRPIRSIHILPSIPPYNDRGIKDAHIDAILKGAVVKSVDVTFREPEGKDPNWADVVMDAPLSDHLRITIKSFYKLGSAVAEIELK